MLNNHPKIPFLFSLYLSSSNPLFFFSIGSFPPSPIARSACTRSKQKALSATTVLANAFGALAPHLCRKLYDGLKARNR